MQVIAMKIHKGEIQIATYPEPMKCKIGLPDGCEGMLLLFKSKKAARAFCENDVELLEYQTKPKEVNKKDD